MSDNTIYLDDWNTVFREIPQNINDNTYKVINSNNYYVALDEYAELKEKLALITKNVGDFDFINHATGDQAVITAITLFRKYFGIKNLYIAKQAYHGITIKSFREGIFSFKEISIFELEIETLLGSLDKCCKNSMLIIEPFLFYAKYGETGIDKVRAIVSKAKKIGMLVMLDETRSGVFSTGNFLFTEKCLPIDFDCLCFSKGLALGTITSVLTIRKGVLPDEIIKKEDTLKSCMAISKVAMQRSNDLLDYYLNDMDSFNKKMIGISEKLKFAFSPFILYSLVKQVNIMGMSCVFVFDNNIKKSQLKFLWLYMISKKIEVRFTEDNLWFFSFALDSSNEEIQRVRDALQDAIKQVDFNIHNIL